MIPSINQTIANWNITIQDNGTRGRNHDNPNKLNYLKNDRICKIQGCTRTFRIDHTIGLCDTHKKHSNDLFL